MLSLVGKGLKNACVRTFTSQCHRNHFDLPFKFLCGMVQDSGIRSHVCEDKRVLCFSLCACVCVCVCVWEGHQRERTK